MLCAPLRPIELNRQRGRPALVLEDPGGEPLARAARSTAGGGTFLNACDWHRDGSGQGPRGLIHKGIRPANILTSRIRPTHLSSQMFNSRCLI